MALQGKWGVGKTHLWREVLKSCSASTRKPASYVSLFGINSLESMREAIAFSDLDVVLGEEVEENNRVKVTEWLKRFRGKIAKTLKFSAEIAPSGILNGAGLSRALGALSFYGVKDRLICIDDIERRGAGLSLEDCLGLVTYLVDHKGCSICVILSPDNLGIHAATWENQREKVFEYEVTFSPSPDEAATLGLKAYELSNWHPYAYAAFLELKISNIRLMQRSARLISLAFSSIDQPSEEVTESLTRAILFAEYCNSGRALGAPPLDYAMKVGGMEFIIDEMRKQRGEQGMTEESAAWTKIVQAYKFDGEASLSVEARKIVTSGFPTQNSLAQAVSATNFDQTRAKAQSVYFDSWSLYRDYLIDNQDEAVAAIEKSWSVASTFQHATSLQTVAGFVRRWGSPDRASSIIDQWIAERLNGRHMELHPLSLNSLDPITDLEILEKTARAFEQENIGIPLSVAMDKMSKEEIRDEIIAAVSSRTTEDILAYVEANPSPTMTKAIKAFCTLPRNDQNPNWEIARNRMREAIEINSRKSAWNAERNKRYGVTID